MSPDRNWIGCRRCAWPCWLLFVVALTSPAAANAQQSDSKLPLSELQKLDGAVDRGLKFLEQGQQANGAFTPEVGSGITALAVTAALRNGRTVDDPMVSKGLKALESFIKPDGGIYGSGRLKNYETCVAMLAFAAANKDGRYKDVLTKAKSFVTELQTGEKPLAADDPWFGGVGYAGSGRPDLSNTSFFIEALKAADTSADDVAMQRAIKFVARCQNLAGQGNDTKFAELIQDGGFYYELPKEKVDPSTSPERYSENGGLRSYGSMTYAGFKSMIYAGLKPDDPRVLAAISWIRKNYSLKQNPGMGKAGLFFYYHTFAAALQAAGLNELTTEDGAVHNWRADLIQELASQQKPDGSWTNENRQWFEDNPNLATSFALLALAHSRQTNK